MSCLMKIKRICILLQVFLSTVSVAVLFEVKKIYVIERDFKTGITKHIKLFFNIIIIIFLLLCIIIITAVCHIGDDISTLYIMIIYNSILLVIIIWTISLQPANLQPTGYIFKSYFITIFSMYLYSIDQYGRYTKCTYKPTCYRWHKHWFFFIIVDIVEKYTRTYDMNIMLNVKKNNELMYLGTHILSFNCTNWL